jgi:hypothetical protein
MAATDHEERPNPAVQIPGSTIAVVACECEAALRDHFGKGQPCGILLNEALPDVGACELLLGECGHRVVMFKGVHGLFRPSDRAVCVVHGSLAGLVEGGEEGINTCLMLFGAVDLRAVLPVEALLLLPEALGGPVDIACCVFHGGVSC